MVLILLVDIMIVQIPVQNVMNMAPAINIRELMPSVSASVLEMIHGHRL
jgi:hypothetical protein